MLEVSTFVYILLNIFEDAEQQEWSKNNYLT